MRLPATHNITAAYIVQPMWTLIVRTMSVGSFNRPHSLRPFARVASGISIARNRRPPPTGSNVNRDAESPKRAGKVDEEDCPSIAGDDICVPGEAITYCGVLADPEETKVKERVSDISGGVLDMDAVGESVRVPSTVPKFG
eukprot:Opistho-2@2810